MPRAQRVRVRGTRRGDVRIIVRDDGRGFDPAAVDASAHLGLEIMRARAERSGGALSVQTQPGAGTTIVATFHWPRSNKMSRWRLLLADDHELFRAGLAGLIDSQPDLQVVGRRATASRRSRWRATAPGAAGDGYLDAHLQRGGGGAADPRHARAGRPAHRHAHDPRRRRASLCCDPGGRQRLSAQKHQLGGVPARGARRARRRGDLAAQAGGAADGRVCTRLAWPPARRPSAPPAIRN
jgi:hypothetical protein